MQSLPIMLSSFRMDILHVLIFLMPALLRTASAYVAQSPDVLVTPVFSSNVATIVNSSMISSYVYVKSPAELMDS